MRTDPTGEAWWHWAIAAAVVAVCAVAVVATAGGAATGIAAIAAVGSGMAASTTASTVAAAAFIGSATCLAVSALNAASEPNSVSDFNSQGNWTTVATTVGGAIVGAGSAYISTKGSTASATSNISESMPSTTINNDVIDLPRNGSALKTDPYHAFPDIVDNYVNCAVQNPISNGTLYQLSGSLNGTERRFEWIIQNQQITHRMFVPGGEINGIPIMP